MDNIIIFAVFSNAQGRSKEVYSSRELIAKHPAAKTLNEAVNAEAAEWDINPVVETYQGYKYEEDAQDKLREFVYAVLHAGNVRGGADLYYDMDFDAIAQDMIRTEYVNQTPYYYYDDHIDDSELVQMVKDNQR